MRKMTRAWAFVAVAALCAACAENGSPTGAGSVSGGTVADFAGQFSGTYRVTRCTDDGVFLGSCDASGLTTETLPIALGLSQNQSTVTGTVTLGSLSGAFTGTASGSTLTGTATLNEVTDQGATLTTSITSWNTSLSGNRLAGEFDVILRAPASPGSVTLNATIEQLSR
jgi:hypothetical protein